MRLTAPRIRRLLGCLLVLAPVPSAGAAVSEQATAPLDRAAYAVLPGVYDVTVTVRIVRMADDRRRAAINRDVAFTGTAFGIGPGLVVTARHVVAPTATALRQAAIVNGITAARAFDPNDVRVTANIRAIGLRRASVGDDRRPPTIAATVRTASEGPSDLALLAIDDRHAPTLTLDEGASSGTPVAAVGFGDQGGPTPALRPGQLNLQGRVPGSSDRSLVTISGMTAVAGDSGAPVIDADGRVHGVLIRRAVARGESAVMARTSAVKRLAESAGAVAAPTQAGVDFLGGMYAFWRYDYENAATALQSAATALPDTPWVATQADRASALQDAEYAVVQHTPWRVPLVVGGLLAIIVSLGLGSRLMRLGRP